MMRETAMDHRHLGILAHMLGDRDDAIEHLRRAIELAVEVGLPWTVMLAARSMAAVLVDDQPELACRILGNTEATSALFGYLPTPDESELVETAIAAATASIGAEAVARATAAGAVIPFTDLPALVGN
jgi:hypothetical protein